MEVADQAHPSAEAIKAAGDPVDVDAPATAPTATPAAAAPVDAPNDAPLAEHPLTNGHDHPEASAHEPPVGAGDKSLVNGHHATAAAETAPELPPVTNGHQAPVEPQIESVAAASTTAPVLPAPSGQLVPESAPGVKPQEAEVAADVIAPAVPSSPPWIQPPTSDVREVVSPQDPERLAQIKEQKQQEDVAATASPLPEINTEVIAPDTAPVAVAPAVAEPSAPADQNVPSSTSLSNQEPIASSVPAPMEVVEAPNHPPVPVPTSSAPEAPLDPAPTPVPESSAPAQASTAPPPLPQEQPTTGSSADQVMADAPPSPSKISREREDDEADGERLAKRAKTDESTQATTEFKKPEVPAEVTEPSRPAAPAPDQAAGSPMTKPQSKHILKTINNLKRITSAKMFLLPVDPVALNLPTYTTVIKNPMDLKTLEDNLRAEQYTTVDAAVADFNQIVENSRLFNGPEHPVTTAALNMKSSFDKNMEKLPGPDAPGPVVERKKKIQEPAPVKIPPARRESRSSLPGVARSPASAASPQTFALSPDGVPLIRRDSTVDGRPKREIHRPAPKDLPYNQKPKKKKYQWELKFCQHVLHEMAKPKYSAQYYPFAIPVDPVALNIPTYHSVVKKPMDFGTIQQKLDRGEFENAKDFENDVRLVFANCYKFNPPGDAINNAGHDLEKIFDGEWSKKREWLENNIPTSGPQSPRSSPEAEESEEEEEEEEEEEDDENDATELQKLQQHIAMLSRQVEAIQKKKKKSPPADKKKGSKPKASKKESKKSSASAAPKAKPTKKSSAPKVKEEKIPFVTYEQKQDISLRINSLSETKMAQALKIIRDNMPGLKGVQDDEIELDIDELSNEVLYKLLVFVRKHAPRPDDEPIKPVATAASSSAAPARKKNKPMSKHEQEARIAQVQNSLSAYNQGSPPAYQTSRPNADQDSDSNSESSEEE